MRKVIETISVVFAAGVILAGCGSAHPTPTAHASPAHTRTPQESPAEQAAAHAECGTARKVFYRIGNAGTVGDVLQSAANWESELAGSDNTSAQAIPKGHNLANEVGVNLAAANLAIVTAVQGGDIFTLKVHLLKQDIAQANKQLNDAVNACAGQPWKVEP